MDAREDATYAVLPYPRSISLRPGVCTGPFHVAGSIPDSRLLSAVAREFPGESASAGGTPIRFTESRQLGMHAYRLTIEPGAVTIEGGSAAACFWALQTLKQWRTEDRWRCVVIDDEPEFDVRGVLHDVTRGKVPRLETLRRLLDLLSAVKVTHLHLNIEHAFCFSFDRDICGDEGGLTRDEAQAICAYAHERFVEIVPCLASLGHMGRVLSLPRYKDLAEVATEKTWAELSWPERARGFTLDPSHPEARELVGRMWREILDAFPTDVVNLCGDEPWDLGKGRNTASLSEDERGRLYLDHMAYIQSLCESAGRACTCWADVFAANRAVRHDVSRNLTLLHWGYEHDADYDATRAFVDEGFQTVVCPGVSGWKRVVNAISLAEMNIDRFAAAGRNAGAVGLIVTDWGDHGHFHPLAASLHGILLGACKAWHAAHPVGASFDDLVGRSDLFPLDEQGVARLRVLGDATAPWESWHLLWRSPAACLERGMPTESDAEVIVSAADDALRSASESSGEKEDVLRGELIVACRFARILAGKAALLSSGRFNAADATDRVKAWEEDLQNAAEVYRAIWQDRNKTGWRDIASALARCRSEMRNAVPRAAGFEL